MVKLLDYVLYLHYLNCLYQEISGRYKESLLIFCVLPLIFKLFIMHSFSNSKNKIKQEKLESLESIINLIYIHSLNALFQ